MTKQNILPGASVKIKHLQAIFPKQDDYGVVISVQKANSAFKEQDSQMVYYVFTSEQKVVGPVFACEIEVIMPHETPLVPTQAL